MEQKPLIQPLHPVSEVRCPKCQGPMREGKDNVNVTGLSFGQALEQNEKHLFISGSPVLLCADCHLHMTLPETSQNIIHMITRSKDLFETATPIIVHVVPYVAQAKPARTRGCDHSQLIEQLVDVVARSRTSILAIDVPALVCKDCSAITRVAVLPEYIVEAATLAPNGIQHKFIPMPQHTSLRSVWVGSIMKFPASTHGRAFQDLRKPF